MKVRLKQLSQALGLVWDSAPGWMTISLLISILQGLVPALSLYLTKAVVDALSLLLSQSVDARDFAPLIVLLPFLVGLTLVSWVFRSFSVFATEAQSSAVALHVQGILQQKALEVDYQCYEDPVFHTTMRMAHGEASSRPTSIVRNLISVVRSFFTLVSISAVLFSSYAYLIPVVVLAVIPGTVGRVFNARARHAWRLKFMTKDRYLGYLHSLLTTASFAKELRVFGHADAIKKEWKDLRIKQRGRRLKLTRDRLVLQTSMDILSYLIAGCGVVLVFLRLRGGDLSLTMGGVAMLFRAFQGVKGALSNWLMGLTSLYEDSLFIAHFYDFMGLPQKIKSPASPKDLPQNMQSGVCVENVTFRYPGTDKDILRNVSCVIKQGEHVALVGENGAGKTTLAKLLCRLYDPTSGRITIDGTDIREFRIEDLRRWMGVLFQDYTRYFMTAGENIRIGDITLQPGDPRIEDAARRSGAAEVIEGLPNGYDTMLGRMFEGGCELSVGQWQRLALARTLLRDADFVVLDEHTSALDPKAEHKVLRQLFESVSGTTALVISHRLSTVTMVDRIIVLDKGCVVEDGSHDDLMRQNGVYRDLFSASAR